MRDLCRLKRVVEAMVFGPASVTLATQVWCLRFLRCPR